MCVRSRGDLEAENLIALERWGFATETGDCDEELHKLLVRFVFFVIRLLILHPLHEDLGKDRFHRLQHLMGILGADQEVFCEPIAELQFIVQR